MPIHEGRDELPYEDISDTLEGRFIASYRVELKRLKAEVRRLSGQIKREEAHAERNLRRWEKAQQHIQRRTKPQAMGKGPAAYPRTGG
jgi:hypothetical protein